MGKKTYDIMSPNFRHKRTTPLSDEQRIEMEASYAVAKHRAEVRKLKQERVKDNGDILRYLEHHKLSTKIPTRVLGCSKYVACFEVSFISPYFSTQSPTEDNLAIIQKRINLDMEAYGGSPLYFKHDNDDRAECPDVAYVISLDHINNKRLVVKLTMDHPDCKMAKWLKLHKSIRIHPVFDEAGEIKYFMMSGIRCWDTSVNKYINIFTTEAYDEPTCILLDSLERTKQAILDEIDSLKKSMDRADKRIKSNKAKLNELKEQLDRNEIGTNFYNEQHAKLTNDIEMAQSGIIDRNVGALAAKMKEKRNINQRIKQFHEDHKEMFSSKWQEIF